MTSSTYDLQWSFPSPLGGSVAQHINRQSRRRLTRELTKLKLLCSFAIRRSIKKLRMKGTHKVKVTHRGEKNRSGTEYSLKTDWKQRRNSERGAAPGPETNAKPKDNFGSPVYRPLTCHKKKAKFVKLVSYRYQTLNLTITATSHMLSWGTPGTRVSLCCSTTGEIHRSTSRYSLVETLQNNTKTQTHIGAQWIIDAFYCHAHSVEGQRGTKQSSALVLSNHRRRNILRKRWHFKGGMSDV